MKFLHTSDLHIGKKLDGFSRIEEQSKVLNEIIDVAVKNEIDVVLIAGDVYDTYIPSSEAENLFFEFIDRLTQNKIVVITISGNHDDEDRLTASKTLASKRGAFLCGRDNDFILGDYGKVTLSQVGENFVVLSKDEESCFIATLPYFGEAPKGYAFDKEKDYNQKVKEVLDAVFANKKDNQTGILLTHLFMMGGKTSESERCIDLGGIKVVSVSSIPSQCEYTALGHLHKRQCASKTNRIIYSGSPLQYSYDEVGIEKSVTLFEVKSNAVENVTEVLLTSGKKLVKVSCVGLDSADVILSKYQDNYIDFTLFSDRPLTVEETAGLKERYPNITKLKLELSGQLDGSRITGRKHLSDKEMFVEFIKEKYGKEPDEQLLTAYLEIISEE